MALKPPHTYAQRRQGNDQNFTIGSDALYFLSLILSNYATHSSIETGEVTGSLSRADSTAGTAATVREESQKSGGLEGRFQLDLIRKLPPRQSRLILGRSHHGLEVVPVITHHQLRSYSNFSNFQRSISLYIYKEGEYVTAVSRPIAQPFVGQFG